MSSVPSTGSIKAGAAIRRWYVVLLVLALMSLPVSLVSRTSGVYWSKVDVVFYPPGTAAGGNPLRSDSRDIVHYAALIERQVEGQAHSPLLQTTGATLYGVGVRDGYSIYLPNAGGQWQSEFNRAAISVEVVGGDEAGVHGRLTTLVQRIRTAANEHQASMGILPRAFITTSLSPESPEVRFQPARPENAVTALSLLALGLAVSAAVVTDNIIATRGARRGKRSAVDEI